jgi:hypothetical protein
MFSKLATSSGIARAPNSNEQTNKLLYKLRDAKSLERRRLEKIKATICIWLRSYVAQRREAGRNRFRSDGM